MQIKQICNVLKQTSIGESLSDEEANRLALVGTLKDAVTSTELLVEGVPSDSLLVILEGEAEILKATKEGKLERLATCRQGAVVGEIGLLSNIPRAATVRTLSPCVVFVLERQDFDRLLSIGDSAAVKLAVAIGRELGIKLHQLTDDVGLLLDEHDELQRDIKRFQKSLSIEEWEKLKSDIWERSQRLRSSQVKLHKQLYSVNPKPEPVKKSRRGTEISLALATGMVTTLIILYFIGGLEAIFSLISRKSPDEVTPSVFTQEQCEQNPDSVWRNGECLDL